MSVYKLYFNIVADLDSVASLDIQNDGYITGLSWFMTPVGCDALNDGVAAEVSFMSTNTFNVSDVRGSIDMVGSVINFLTSGGGNMAVVKNMENLKVPVNAGERIHLHGNITGGGTAATHVYLYVEDGVEDTKPRRRLR